MLDIDELIKREILVNIDGIYCLYIGWVIVKIPSKDHIEEFVKKFKDYYIEILPFWDRYKKPTTKPKLIKQTEEKIKYLESVHLL